jgi:dTDP-4-dehydrorhamnose reductase
MQRHQDTIAERAVLVVGAKGQLGAALVNRLAGTTTVVGLDVDELDVTDEPAVRRTVSGVQPGVVINCSAFNDVDGAEREPLSALRVNALAVVTLAGAAAACGATFVHYGSDFVFDGVLGDPYREEDLPSPLSVYGMSKLLGEQAATMVRRHYVLRLSSLYGGHTGRTTVDRVVRLARAGEPVLAFTDRTVSPSYVPDVAAATLELVARGAPSGLYHCGSTGWCTWSELASYILARLGCLDLLQAAPVLASRFQAIRPRHCALQNVALAREGIFTRHWRDALDHYLDSLNL